MFRVMYDFVVNVCIYCASLLGASLRSGVGFMGKRILPRGNSRAMPSYMLVDDSSQFEFTRLIRAPGFAVEINICTFSFLQFFFSLSRCYEHSSIHTPSNNLPPSSSLLLGDKVHGSYVIPHFTST